MPSVSIYIDDEILESVDDQLEPDESRSEWVQRAVQRELDHTHNDIESLEQEMNKMKNAIDGVENDISEINQWRRELLDDIVDWFGSEFGPSK